MSQSSSNSPIDRVVSWFRNLLGGQSGPAAGGDAPTSPATAATPAASTATQANTVDAVSSDVPSTAATQAQGTTTASAKEQVDAINAARREEARKLVRPLDTEPGGDLPDPTSRPGEMGNEPVAPAERGQPTGASSDEFSAGGYTPEPVSVDDVEQAAAGDGAPPATAGAASTSHAAPRDAGQSGSVAGGTYAATPGDIASEGESTESDLGLVDDGDLSASELGVLENAEGAQLARQLDQEQARYGIRPGADLSRTGLYASIRGEDDAGNAEVSPRGDDGNVGIAAGDEDARDAGARFDEGPGNTDMTAGDDYSAERAAEQLPGAAMVSTTTADIGQAMASGEEVRDLVGGDPASTPPSGVAVDAEPTDVVATGSAGYAGAVRGDGTANTPPGYPVKGNGSSMIYHTPEMASYPGTKPDWCFATAEDAEAAGFRAPRRHQQGANA